MLCLARSRGVFLGSVINRARCLLPSAKPARNFAAIHSPHIRNRRNKAMRNTLPTAP